MISKVTVKNLMSWKGYHEVDYPEGMVLFDGPYGAGKSSLLTDSLDLVFSAGARSKLPNLVTRWQTEMEVSVFMDIGWKKYKFYFFYRLKSESKDSKGKIKKVWAKTIWESYELEGEEYKKINLTPERILWVNYNQVAKKTFLIGQFDLDIFSKAGPSEKYDIIAEAFQIAKLFKIWDSASNQIKALRIKKEQIEESLEGLDTSEFEKKEGLIEEKNKLEKVIKEKEKALKEENTKKEQELILQNEKKYYDNIIANIGVHNLNIDTLEKSDYKEDLKKIKEIRDLIEKSKDPLLEKKENSLGAAIAEKGHLEEQKTTKEEGINNKYMYSISNKSQETKTVIESLQGIDIYNTEVEQTIEKDIELYKSLNKEETEEKINKLEEKNKEINIDNSSLSKDLSKTDLLIKNVENLTGAEDCPTCKRPFSKEEGKKIKESLEAEQVKVNKALKENNENLIKIQEQLKELQNILVWIDYYKKYVSIQELKIKGKSLQKELKELKESKVKELEGLNSFDEKINKKIELIKKLEEEIKNLKKESNIDDLNKRLNDLCHKQWNIGGSLYKVEQLDGFIEWQKQTITNLEEQSKGYKEKLKGYDEKRLDKIVEEIDKKEEAIRGEREVHTELSNRVSRIKENEDYYKKIKDNIESINIDLTIYEKINAIFWKKGEPRTLLQNYIIPQLENNVNDILEEIAEGMYRIEFKLTAKTASGEESKKNTFDIIVYQQWVDQSYDTLSGWERTNINYSIRLGITETLNDILWTKVSDFLVLDETFRGDLDASNGWEALANSVIRTMWSGRFKQIFIITHTDYIKDKLEDMSSIIKIEKRAKYSRLAI